MDNCLIYVFTYKTFALKFKVFLLCLSFFYFILENFQHTVIDEKGIYANNELSLKYIDVYGFDYDYTLASYSNALHFLIYDLAIGNLISMYGVSDTSCWATCGDWTAVKRKEMLPGNLEIIFCCLTLNGFLVFSCLTLTGQSFGKRMAGLGY